MKTFNVPASLHEVFGEKQTWLEVIVTMVFSIMGTGLIYGFLYEQPESINLAALIIGFVLLWDVLAGCIANFTQGTNDYYAKRSTARWVFIAIHFHIIVIAWLLQGPIIASMIVWVFTIFSAILVNVLAGNRFQLFIAANLVCLGVLLIILLAMPMWFMAVSIFFLIKVVFSFAVNHYA